ncbi:hypothetical protein AMTR_s00013p00258970 [Amborella trichopoda]|uniref:Uncharacterized protein n=1 Tax=Amborella trichopoda TaxID=13333 RepID=W1PJB0_AMBTC|nr:hypothetical protein AMTR_s00013p00258970 [Amborella trichopoda]
MQAFYAQLDHFKSYQKQPPQTLKTPSSLKPRIHTYPICKRLKGLGWYIYNSESTPNMVAMRTAAAARNQRRNLGQKIVRKD